MDIIDKIKELNLPHDQYIIIGSGTMDVLGIREAQDIDISVTKDLFNKLKESGEWEEYEKYEKQFLKKDIFDVNKQLFFGTVEEANKLALFIENIPFMNLDELIKFKTAMGRDKDFKDIELIRNYQNIIKEFK